MGPGGALVPERQSLRTKRRPLRSEIGGGPRPFGLAVIHFFRSKETAEPPQRTLAVDLSRTGPFQSVEHCAPRGAVNPSDGNLAVPSLVSRRIQAALEACAVRLVVSEQVLEALVFALILRIGQADPRNVGVGVRTRTRSVLAGALR